MEITNGNLAHRHGLLVKFLNLMKSPLSGRHYHADV